MKRLARNLGPSVLAFALASLASPRAHAVATFELVVGDAAGTGFNDMTAATPVGGNMGTTLGEQRRIAFHHALDMWARVLESNVPIVVSATFAPFECTNGFAALGQASSSSVEFEVPGVDPTWILPEALADQIAGVDLMPGLPDIEAEFNGGIADCLGDFDWYYGLDGMTPRNTADLVQVVLHEVAHGLGFSGFVDPETGQDLAEGFTDPFTVNLLDLATEKHWDEMTDTERMMSAITPRGLVWDGQYANDAARAVLTPGAVHITTMPAVTGFQDLLIDGNFGPRVTAPITGPVTAVTIASCATPLSGVTGAIAIASGDTCHPMNIGYSAEQGGAIAALITTDRLPPENFDVPSEDLTVLELGIPTIGITSDDAELLLAATGTMVTLSADMDQLIGADPEGRMYMYASSPASTSSTASHFDPVARPDLTMEPAESPNPRHDITIERALLRDIGWRTLCGNGMPDANEECDAGPANSDTTPDACRTTCRRASCGDGVVDTGEACDPEADTTCSATCTRPVCGNGTREAQEECDNGASNSNSTPNACRTTCENPSCGDGVVDTGESCDDALTPATCRLCMVLMTGTGGAAGSGAAGGSAGNVGTGGTGEPPRENDDDDDDEGDDGGCGCRVTGGARSMNASYALLLAVLALRARRRTTRRAK